jgi:hypothetical protein
MATPIAKRHSFDIPSRTESDDDRPSGVPAPGHLGASTKELWGGLLGVLVLGVVVAAFWLASR